MTPHQVLDLPETATLDQVKTRFRQLMFDLHPDRGAGDTERYQEVIKAHRVLKARLETCGLCHGSGRITTMSGFHSISVPCGTCGGRG